MAPEVAVMCGNTWNVHTGIRETALPPILIGTYFVPCALKPSGAVEPFRLYPKETNKNPNTLPGKRVALVLKPKAWHMLATLLTPRGLCPVFETAS